LLDDLALTRDQHALSEVADDGRIVGDEDIGEAEPVFEVGRKVDHLSLDGYIEGGDGFVADDEFRLESECLGDGDALTLATLELVG